MYAEVLKEKDINAVREELQEVVPMAAASTRTMLSLDGDSVKAGLTRWQLASKDLQKHIKKCEIATIVFVFL